jgi:hypothetical protein
MFLYYLNEFITTLLFGSNCCIFIIFLLNKQVIYQLEDQIPSDKAINNHLSYYHKMIGQHTNKFEVVEAELHHYTYG